MDINLFNENEGKAVTSAIQTTDAEKFQKIVNILCSKRKKIEDSIEKEGNNATDDERLELRNLVEEMKTFGISEIDYQKWLVMEVKKGN